MKCSARRHKNRRDGDRRIGAEPAAGRVGVWALPEQRLATAASGAVGLSSLRSMRAVACDPQ